MNCSDKEAFLSEADAQAELVLVQSKLGAGKVLSVYLCQCHRWHLTSAVNFVLAHKPSTRHLTNPHPYDTRKDPAGFANRPRITA